MSDFKSEWLETDYYKVLGITRKASQKDISKAYRELARKHHPDSNSAPGAEAKFKEISAAYSVLKDPETRKSYDQMQRLGAFQSGTGGAGAGFGRPGGPGGQGHYGSRRTQTSGFRYGGGAQGGRRGRNADPDWSEDQDQQGGGFFSRDNFFFNMGREWPRDGEDIQAKVKLSFDDAVKGTSVSIRQPGANPKKPVKVRIPPLVKNGATLKVSGKGQPGFKGGQAGDLIVKIEVDEHPDFERDGLNLKLVKEVNFPQAALGAKLTIKNYYQEDATFTMPPGTQSGQIFRLAEKGLVKSHQSGSNDTGDLFVEIKVAVPIKLNKKQRAAMQALAETFET